MSKIAVAFCEADEAYRNRFVTYLMEHKAKEIKINAFSAVKPFVEEAQKQKFDVILLGTGFTELAKVLTEKHFPVLLLKDSLPERVAEEEGRGDGVVPELQTVFRYQNMETIIHEIFVLSKGSTAGNEKSIRLSGLEIIGVYSPVRHEMQMPFSMVLSHFMAEKKKVLYINLMENDGFMELFGLEGICDLGDVIVRLRSQKLLPENLWKCIYGMGRVSYIPPFSNPENRHEFQLSDFLGLLRFIEENTDIEMIVIDFGGGLDCFSRMLEVCSSIYCPVRNGYFYECQTNHFKEYLEKTSQKCLKDRVNFVDMPYSAKGIRCGGEVLRQLLYSEFGDYVRDCFTGTVLRPK